MENTMGIFKTHKSKETKDLIIRIPSKPMENAGAWEVKNRVIR